MSDMSINNTRQDETVRILHVEDDPDLADLVATFLKREDDRFDINTAHNAADGLDRLTETSFDCIVSDYDMPGQNGIDFLEAVRSDHPELPFVLFTGKGSEEVASDAIRAGATDYLQKGGGTDQYELLANRVRNSVDQYRATQEARTIHEGHQRILEHISDYVVIVDDSGDISYVSPAVKRVTGYEPEDVIGTNAFEYVHPDDQDVAADAFAETLERTDQAVSVEYRTKTKDGSYRWIEVRGGNYLDDPVIEGIVVSAREISDRKEHEDRLRGLNEMTQDLITAETPERITEIGIEAAATILGLDANSIHLYDDQDALVPAAATDAIHDLVGDIPTFTEGDSIAWRVYEQGETLALDDVRNDLDIYNPETPVRSELYFPLDDHGILIAGSEMPAAFDQQDVVLGEILADAITAALEHVERTDQLRARERELEGTNILLSTLFETLPVGVTVLDTDGMITRANQHAEDVLGLTESEITERTYDDPEWRIVDEAGEPIPADDLPFARVMETGEGVVDYEHGIKWPDGKERWLSINAAPVVAEVDASGSVVGVISDITDQRDYERAIERQNERLERFASAVSHDLRNPLNVAEGRLELAREECNSAHLDDIARAHERMSVLIDDILLLARQGDKASEIESVDLAMLTENCWGSVATGDATLVTDTDRRIQADRSRLQQLLENLIRNAVEHTDEDLTVTIGELDAGFYVEDDGIGIPVEAREEVFEAGYSTTADGTGFGLSIVTRAANAHGWEIRVTDSSEGGARFEITGVGFAG